MKKQIKLFDPFIGKGEFKAVEKVLKSKFWASGSGIGKVMEFETKFNKYVGSDSCIAVNNGTSALHLALSLVDIKNKEVILPSFSFVSTAHAVIYNGGKPVFVDVDPDTMCIDTEEIEKSITSKTKIILPVHYGGMPCDLDKIERICKSHNVHLVEDAAHATGASYGGKKIGTRGMAVCFSFHPVKNLAMPGGGAITLNGKNIHKFNETIRSRRWCGISNRNGPRYDVTDLGWNYYMNEFSAAIGIEQLKKLDSMNSTRKNIAKQYFAEIKVQEKMPFDNRCSYHLYWIKVTKRNEFMKKMREKGIETGIHYQPIHKMKFYNQKLKLKVTEEAGKKIVTIPIHPNLTANDITHIVDSVNKLA